jgi:putative membrane protein
MSAPLRLLVRFGLTILVLWLLALYTPYLAIGGGWTGFIIIAALVTLLNLIVRPLLQIVTLPLKFFATLLAFIIVNGLVVWLLYAVSQRMDSSLVTFSIEGGILGWAVVALVLGFGNWAMKEMLHKHE